MNFSLTSLTFCSENNRTLTSCIQTIVTNLPASLEAVANKISDTISPAVLGSILLTGTLALTLYRLNRAMILYKTSLIYGVTKNYFLPSFNPWWNSIKLDNNKEIILSALPLEKQLDELIKKVKITKVITMTKKWEVTTTTLGFFGYIKPATPQMWANKKIEQVIIETEDFEPLTIEELNKAANAIHSAFGYILTGKPLIHCKAGVGRSAQGVAAYLIKYCGMKPVDAIKKLQADRSLVNLNKRQRAAILSYGQHIEKEQGRIYKQARNMLGLSY